MSNMEPLIDNSSTKFKHCARELADIGILDNHYKVEQKTKEDHVYHNTVISSRMIVEHFGGMHALCMSLFTDAKAGLGDSDKDKEERRRVYGVNSFPPPKIKTIFELIMENFDDPINVILLAAGVVSIAINLL